MPYSLNNPPKYMAGKRELAKRALCEARYRVSKSTGNNSCTLAFHYDKVSGSGASNVSMRKSKSAKQLCPTHGFLLCTSAVKIRRKPKVSSSYLRCRSASCSCRIFTYTSVRTVRSTPMLWPWRRTVMLIRGCSRWIISRSASRAARLLVGGNSISLHTLIGVAALAVAPVVVVVLLLLLFFLCVAWVLFDMASLNR